MTEQKIHMEFPVKGGNFDIAGEAAGKVKNTLKQLGVPYEVIRRVAIASFEAEMNIVAYALDGKICVDIQTDMIHITAADRGPGIEDIEKAMQEGFSTATPLIRERGFGAGMGLPNIRRASDWMHIDSVVGRGTVLEAKFFLGNGRGNG